MLELIVGLGLLIIFWSSLRLIATAINDKVVDAVQWTDVSVQQVLTQQQVDAAGKNREFLSAFGYQVETPDAAADRILELKRLLGNPTLTANAKRALRVELATYSRYYAVDNAQQAPEAAAPIQG